MTEESHSTGAMNILYFRHCSEATLQKEFGKKHFGHKKSWKDYTMGILCEGFNELIRLSNCSGTI